MISGNSPVVDEGELSDVLGEVASAAWLAVAIINVTPAKTIRSRYCFMSPLPIRCASFVIARRSRAYTILHECKG
jgi:hypothetical protein